MTSSWPLMLPDERPRRALKALMASESLIGTAEWKRLNGILTLRPAHEIRNYGQQSLWRTAESIAQGDLRDVAYYTSAGPDVAHAINMLMLTTEQRVGGVG